MSVGYSVDSPRRAALMGGVLMQVAKVYVSVFGDERGADIAIEGLQAKAKYVRMGLGKRMQLRMTPEVRFFRDDAMEKGSRVRGLSMTCLVLTSWCGETS